jgi:hypothetical protein
MLSNILFTIQWLFIGLVSCVDMYFAIKLQDTLYASELNPLGRLLIEWDAGDVALFMGAKCAGTCLVLGYLILVRCKNKKLADRVIFGVTLCQLSLLAYLFAG